MSHKNHDHSCSCFGQTATQSFDEIEFARGIWFAAQYGELNKVKSLIQGGKYRVDQRDSAGYTPLHYAARSGHLDVCQYLLDNGADVNSVTRSGQATALHRASSAGKYAVVTLLLSKNADATLQDSDGKTALHRAASSGHREIYELIENQFPQLSYVADNKGNLPALD